MASAEAKRTFRRHAWAYCAAFVLLSGANWFSGPPWWSFWPLGAWGVAFAIHFLLYKARSVDEDWVAERTADLHSRSYDASHIDRIAADYEKPADGQERKNDG